MYIMLRSLIVLSSFLNQCPTLMEKCLCPEVEHALSVAMGKSGLAGGKSAAATSEATENRCTWTSLAAIAVAVCLCLCLWLRLCAGVRVSVGEFVSVCGADCGEWKWKATATGRASVWVRAAHTGTHRQPSMSAQHNNVEKVERRDLYLPCGKKSIWGISACPPKIENLRRLPEQYVAYLAE